MACDGFDRFFEDAEFEDGIVIEFDTVDGVICTCDDDFGRHHSGT